ncbi:MAG: hypothetical protein B6I20_05480 [Bacteroidetes bacterium 4572_117]|nr:MAG: hypothetical protein B6I20_05480 [Bacteroidetes bacterium 4572_117]
MKKSTLIKGFTYQNIITKVRVLVLDVKKSENTGYETVDYERLHDGEEFTKPRHAFAKIYKRVKTETI